MAENIDITPTAADDEQIAASEMTGTFIGDLHGTADYAKALANAITITVTGDAGGSVTFDGSASKSLELTVSHATEADTATHASTADNVNSAQTAVSANYATTAGHANTADSATTATNAEYATAAGSASSASTATTATEANHAATADEATHAASADTATTATTAETANALADGVFVPNADYATRAGTATYALYDCEGYAFNLVYAKKKDVVLKEDAFTKEQADALYIPITSKILQASVYGKATGTGLVVGSTMQIHITSLAVGDGGTFYGSLEYGDLDEDTADTTKVYLDSNGYFYIWVDEEEKWQQVKAELSDTAQQQLTDMQTRLDEQDNQIAEQEEKLEAGLEQLSDVVTLSTEQRIPSRKIFDQIVYAGIPDLEQDAGHAVVTVHNLKDVQTTLTTEIETSITEVETSITELKEEVGTQLTDIDTQLEEVNKRLDMQDVGNVIISFKDLSLEENQEEMVPGTYYLNFLTEDGTYVQLDPDTGVPADSSQVVFYKRYYLKDDRGNITYNTYRMEVDLTGYASLEGANFTGTVTVPAQDDLDAAADNVVLNKGDINALLAAKSSLYFVTETPDFSAGDKATGIYLVTA